MLQTTDFHETIVVLFHQKTHWNEAYQQGSLQMLWTTSYLQFACVVSKLHMSILYDLDSRINARSDFGENEPTSYLSINRIINTVAHDS